MATDIEKMLRLVTERVGTRLPESIQAESVMQDEEGHVYLRLAIAVHRDIINEIGYYAHPDVSVDVAAAMAALTQLARGQGDYGGKPDNCRDYCGRAERRRPAG